MSRPKSTNKCDSSSYNVYYNQQLTEQNTKKPNDLLETEKKYPIKPCLDCGDDISHRHNTARRCEQCAKIRTRNKDKKRALKWRQDRMGLCRIYRKISYAIETGKLPHPTTLDCVDCGNVAEHYDHRDYSKPLDVEPVCRSCNKIRGRADNYQVIAA